MYTCISISLIVIFLAVILLDGRWLPSMYGQSVDMAATISVAAV